jgi:uncharacterized protein
VFNWISSVFGFGKRVDDDRAALKLAMADYQSQDFKAALAKFRTIADRGNPFAQYYVALMHQHGRGVAKDLRKAVNWYRKAADRGDSMSQVNLGRLYAKGEGVPTDHKAAVKLYQLAAESGSPEGQLNLGVMIFNGLGITEDRNEGVRLYRLAAEQGLAAAQVNLGACLASGSGTTRDKVQALKWYNRAAAQGHELGVENGEELMESMSEEEIAAAEEQSEDQDESLECDDFERRAIEDDPLLAMIEGAERGDLDAMTDLGRLYASRGPDKENLAAAEKLFRQAADKGLPRAMHNLGVLEYDAGNKRQALKWFQAAAAKQWVNSMACIGVIFEESGEPEKALGHFERAAKAGLAEAQDAMGRILIERETDKAYHEARRWSELAANQGVAAANFRLARIYHEGLGVKENRKLAQDHYVKAAQDGHRGAQLMAGVGYHAGAWNEVDLYESAYWLSRAAGQGDEHAKYYLDTRVLPQLSAQQKSKLSERLAADGVTL